MRPDVEAGLARHIARRAVVVGPLVVAVAWIARGPDGAIAAAIGVAIVVGNFLLSGLLLSAAATISMTLYHAAALIGFLLRLVLITVVMLLVAHLFEIDRIAFGVAAVVSYLVLLTLEAAAVVRRGERELEWTS
ncbi:MAG: hypothetical protein HZA58_05685 [Acidimicrobiia bacterium]|nr:hypothetical protein [Acidimicrobiia bacterium]